MPKVFFQREFVLAAILWHDASFLAYFCVDVALFILLTIKRPPPNLPHLHPVKTSGTIIGEGFRFSPKFDIFPSHLGEMSNGQRGQRQLPSQPPKSVPFSNPVIEITGYFNGSRLKTDSKSMFLVRFATGTQSERTLYTSLEFQFKDSPHLLPISFFDMAFYLIS